MNEYQEARGGLPPDLQFPARSTAIQRTDTPHDNTELVLMIDETKSFLIVKREVLERKMDYVDMLLEKVFDRTSRGLPFNPAEMQQISAELEQVRSGFLDATPETTSGTSQSSSQGK